MSDRRYELTPQMREYDRLSPVWTPYSMFRSPSNLFFNCVSTDSFGNRHSVDRSGNLISLDSLDRDEPVSILIGSSSGFGVGATHNRFTISSQLCQLTGKKWLNLSGRAYTSFQEIVNFLSLLPNKIENVILFSGANNLTISLIANRITPEITPFVMEERMKQFSKVVNGEDSGLRGLIKHNYSVIKRRFSKKSSLSFLQQNPEEKFELILQQYTRDLKIWKGLSLGLGFQLHFVLQPLISLFKKKLHPNEKELFNILDTMQGEDWQSVRKEMEARRFTYRESLHSLANGLDIPFLDMNSSDSLAAPEWLFVDRVHLTDLGYSYIAKSINEKLLNTSQAP